MKKNLFAQLHENEHDIAIFRKHWAPFAGVLIPILLIAYLPKFFFDFFSARPETTDTVLALESGETMTLLLFIYSVMLIALFLSTFSVYSDMFLDACVLTSKRVIDIEQGGFFNRESSVFLLTHIQDITVVTPGFFATIFGYGTLIIQTAGERQFEVPYINRPHNAKRLITEAIEKARKAEQAS
jgi:uncharacterized membrane protein YdbT with pleckstrin-like domain